MRRGAPRGPRADDGVVARLHALAPHLDGEPDPAFRAATRARLVAMAAVRSPSRRRSSGLKRLLRRPPDDAVRARWRTRLTAGLAGAALTVTAAASLVALADGARPGDVLYGLKRGTEQTQLALAGDARGTTLLGFASTRLDELRTPRRRAERAAGRRRRGRLGRHGARGRRRPRAGDLHARDDGRPDHRGHRLAHRPRRHDRERRAAGRPVRVGGRADRRARRPGAASCPTRRGAAVVALADPALRRLGARRRPAGRADLLLGPGGGRAPTRSARCPRPACRAAARGSRRGSPGGSVPGTGSTTAGAPSTGAVPTPASAGRAAGAPGAAPAGAPAPAHARRSRASPDAPACRRRPSPACRPR